MKVVVGGLVVEVGSNHVGTQTIAFLDDLLRKIVCVCVCVFVCVLRMTIHIRIP